MENRSIIPVSKTAAIHHKVVVGGICLLLSQIAVADRPIHPYVGTELTYDANLFRLPKNFVPNLDVDASDKVLSTRSSFIKQLKAGIAVKWRFSQQEFLADVNVNQNWFSTFNEFDYTGYNISTLWNWQFTQRFKGELSYNNNLKLNSFQAINRPVNNLINKETYVAKGGYEIIPDWFLRAGFSRTSVRFPNRIDQSSNLTEDTVNLGIRYENTLLGNIAGFFVTITDGKYPNRSDSSPFDNAYTRTTYVLEDSWNYSVKTRLRSRVGYLSQKFKHQTNLDFGNFIARGDILWQPTEKTSLYLEAWRDISEAGNLINSFSLYHGIGLTSRWAWSPKLQLELPISYERQSNAGTVGQNNISLLEVSPRSEQTLIRLNIKYIPVSNVELVGFAGYERRHSTSALHTYQDQLAGITVKVDF